MKGVQCRLRHGIGSIYEVTWVPERFAIKGKALDIKDRFGNWNGPWVVEEVYDGTVELMQTVREHTYPRIER